MFRERATFRRAMTAYEDKFTLCDTMSADWRKQYTYSTTTLNSETLMRCETTTEIVCKIHNKFDSVPGLIKASPEACKLSSCCVYGNADSGLTHTPNVPMSMAGTLVMGPPPWASCQIRKIVGCACAGNTGNVSPRHRGLAVPTCTCRDACRDR